MWETLRAWEHKRVDWVFDHPWIVLIPVMLYGAVFGYMWIEEKLARRKRFR